VKDEASRTIKDNSDVMTIVKRALLSCYDKTALEGFAKGLVELGVHLIASKGTATFLAHHHVPTKTVEEFAGITEQLDGRVKTLHPKIYAGILAQRNDPAHLQTIGPNGLIDLVVVNLYPFEEVSRQPEMRLDDVLEQIDIGGVALLRAAAKNFSHVGVVSTRQQYSMVLDSLREGKGTLPEAMRRQLAAAALQLTSRYDQCIAAFLAGVPHTALAEQLMVQASKRQTLRYGENPHQQAAWYTPHGQPPRGLAKLVQRSGKELSFNNLLDLDTIMRCLRECQRPTCVIVKHTSPCGWACADTITAAYQRAYAGDPESAFGGVVGINRPLDPPTASQMASTFLEVIVAPAIEPAAQMMFAKKPSVRLIALEDLAESDALEWRSIQGGWLIQECDLKSDQVSAWRLVTKRPPSASESRDLVLAWMVVKHIKSNAIVVAADEAVVGIGAGQPSRVRAVRLAIQHAGERCRGAVLASDGFFPFPDSIELAAQGGVTAIVQPGGSVKDAEVIAEANRRGVAMLCTGTRHFRH